MFSIKFFEILIWNAVYYYYYYICHDLCPKGSHHALLTVYMNPFITIQMLLPLKHNTAAVYQQTVILQKHLLILYEEYCVPLQMHVSYHFQFLNGSMPENCYCMQEDTSVSKICRFSERHLLSWHPYLVCHPSFIPLYHGKDTSNQSNVAPSLTK